MLVKAATALDPRFKELKCVDFDLIEAVWDHLLSLIEFSLTGSSADSDAPDTLVDNRKQAYESSSNEDDHVYSIKVSHNSISLLPATQAGNITSRVVPQLAMNTYLLLW